MFYLILLDAIRFSILCGLVNISHTLLHAFVLIVRKNERFKNFDFPPIDRNTYIGTSRVFGDSVTWGGFIISIVVGVILQAFASPYGVLIGLSVFVGHVIGSFIKRRMGVPRGGYVPIVDHGDYVIFTGAVMFCLGAISLPVYIVSIIFILLVHPLFCVAGYRLGMRQSRH